MVQTLSLSCISQGVYISDIQAALDISTLRAAKITSILKLYTNVELLLGKRLLLPGAQHSSEVDKLWPEDFRVCDIPLQFDSFVKGEQFDRGVQFMQAEQTAGNQVAVVCVSGVSRAPTFVLAYLMEQGYSLREAWRLLRSRLSLARPTLQMWLSLFEHYRLPYTAIDIMNWQTEVESI